jgi:hypothetical protein
MDSDRKRYRATPVRNLILDRKHGLAWGLMTNNSIFPGGGLTVFPNDPLEAGKGGEGGVLQIGMAGPGEARRGEAGRGRAGHGMAGLGRAWGLMTNTIPSIYGPTAH